MSAAWDVTERPGASSYLLEKYIPVLASRSWETDVWD